MRIADVQKAISGPSTSSGQVLTGVAYDSRAVTRGNVFVALKGVHADGATFARQAVERGAVAVVAEQPLPDLSVPVLQASDARLALAELAADFYGHPSGRLRVVGITGTNGKTTTAYLLAAIFEAGGVKCGVIGTVAHRIGSEERASSHTTPEAPELQRMLSEMADRDCGACAMEVSSHALALRRVDTMTFAAGVFTNLTRDHLAGARQRRRSEGRRHRRGELEAGDVRHQPRGRHHAGPAVVFNRRPCVRHPHASRHAEGAQQAGWPAERLQHSCGCLDGGRAGPAL
jgi:UDP-N-acetylmuramoyl-L-alanyl-D-glutamate--2,6-diaminopimelate ligase